VRYWTPDQEPGPWAFEIIGVVGQLGMNTLAPTADQGLYHAVAPGELHPLRLAVRVGNDPERFTPRLRSIITEIDASAFQSAMPLAAVPDPNRQMIMLVTYLVILLAGIAVLLAAACLYALMSFTVAERTRESAIRSALGARPANIVSSIATRALVQLSLGVLIGTALSAGMFSFLGHLNAGPVRTASWPLNIAVLALFMVAVGMVACVRPTLRAIRIQPVDALKG
jgi:ABC-type antimicrobial peptide transport system permease subunit